MSKVVRGCWEEGLSFISSRLWILLLFVVTENEKPQPELRIRICAYVSYRFGNELACAKAYVTCYMYIFMAQSFFLKRIDYF